MMFVLEKLARSFQLHKSEDTVTEHGVEFRSLIGTKLPVRRCSTWYVHPVESF